VCFKRIVNFGYDNYGGRAPGRGERRGGPERVAECSALSEMRCETIAQKQRLLGLEGRNERSDVIRLSPINGRVSDGLAPHSNVACFESDLREEGKDERTTRGEARGFLPFLHSTLRRVGHFKEASSGKKGGSK